MTLKIILLTLAVTIGTCLTAQAAIIQFDLPNSTERIAVEIPKGWKKAYENQTSNQTIYEYTFKGQPVTNWDEMVTVTTGPLSPPSEHLNEEIAKFSIEALLSSVCKEPFGRPSIVSGIRNGFPIAYYQVACFTKPEARNSPTVRVKDFELLTGLIIVGSNGLFQIHRVWHTDEFAKDRKPGGLISNGYQAMEKIGKFGQAHSDYVLYSSMPCDTVDNAKPCGPPPLKK